jgi:predicted dehydrogenase
MAEPLAVGLVGAGTWAARMHAPTLAAGPETRLAAVWSRRRAAAEALVAGLGTASAARVSVADSFEDLLRRCDAVAFAVPPDVQAELGVRAAEAGKALLLEKPLALDLPAAEALAAAVDRAGVVSQVVFTKRYHPRTRAFLARAAGPAWSGARACYLHDGFLSGPFAAGWRLTHGALFDLGPHVLDLLDAAAGPITAVEASGDATRWVSLTCRHAGGATSQVALSGSVRVPGTVTEVDLYGAQGTEHFDTVGLDHDECWPVIRREFAQAVRGGAGHPLDVRRGLMVQRLLDLAAASLQVGRTGTTRA